MTGSAEETRDKEASLASAQLAAPRRAGGPGGERGQDQSTHGADRTEGLARGSAWIAVLPTLVTLLVTLYKIKRPTLSRDEGATLLAIHRSYPELLRMLGNVDVVHGLYYSLMWVVVRVAGSSTLALRFPGAVAMAITAGGITLIGRRLLSGRAGLAAGLVFAALPAVSLYAQTARDYPLVAAFATAASYLLLRALEDGSRRRRWLVAYGVAMIAVGLGNIFALLLIAAHAVTLAWWARRRGRAARGVVLGWLAAVIAAVVVVSPVIVLGYAQRYQITWIKSPRSATVTTTAQLIGNPAEVVAVIAVTLCGLAASMARGRARLRADWPPSLAALALPWLLVPGALLVAVSAIHPIYNVRYIVFCLPALALLAGTALAALSRAFGRAWLGGASGRAWLGGASPGWAIAVAGLTAIAVAGVSMQVSERSPAGHDYLIFRADRIVAQDARPGDAVLNISFWPMSHGGGPERLMEAEYPFGLARLRDVSMGSAPAPSATLGGTFAPVSVIRHRLATVSRVWVAAWTLRPHRPIASWSQRPKAFLRSLGFVPVHLWHCVGLRLWLYVRPAGSG